MRSAKEFIQFRAEKLAYVFFSRRDDLLIKEMESSNSLLDLMIDILENGEQTGRYFGVDVKATESEPLNLKDLHVDLRKYANINFPVMLAAINTRRDNGFLVWIKKPLKNGKLRLIENIENATIEAFDKENLDDSISQMKGWYEMKAMAV